MRLHISRQQISRIFNLFGIEHHSPLPSPMQNISQLERTKDIANRPYLIIWAGSRKYEVFTNYANSFPVSLPELDWLAYELSNWLGLPITRE